MEERDRGPCPLGRGRAYYVLEGLESSEATRDRRRQRAADGVGPQRDLAITTGLGVTRCNSKRGMGQAPVRAAIIADEQAKWRTKKRRTGDIREAEPGTRTVVMRADSGQVNALFRNFPLWVVLVSLPLARTRTPINWPSLLFLP